MEATVAPFSLRISVADFTDPGKGQAKSWLTWGMLITVSDHVSINGEYSLMGRFP